MVATLTSQGKGLYGGLSGKVPLPGVELIKEFEGCHLEAYPDPLTGGKPYTIGWGCTRKKDGCEWVLGEKITQDEADALLIHQLEQNYLPYLEKIPIWKELNAYQQGALLSFAYNLGAQFYGGENFQTITRILSSKQWHEIESALVLYRNPGSRVEEGLKRRRLAEAKLFLKEINTSNSSGNPDKSLSLGAELKPDKVVDVSVPYFSQRDNKYNPSGSCNVTSVAMCLAYFGVKGDGSEKQLEDQMYMCCERNGWSRHEPEGLKKLIESYPGCKDNLTRNGSLADIRKALDEGKPCIVHGFFSGFGHIVVIRGYDEKNFYVNDPWGEWFPWGYDNTTSGERLRYSKRALAACCDSFSQGEAMERYARMTDRELESAQSIWLHRVYRESGGNSKKDGDNSQPNLKPPDPPAPKPIQPIQMRNIIKYFQDGNPQHEQAIAYLQQKLEAQNPQILAEISAIWRSAPLATGYQREISPPKVRVTFRMELANQPRSNLATGTLDLNVEGRAAPDQFTVTSGQPGYQYWGSTDSKGKGPLPSCQEVGIENYWIELKELYRPNSKGINGYAFNIAPNPLTVRGVWRGDFMIHDDTNQDNGPGSSGCIVFIYANDWNLFRDRMRQFREQGLDKVPLIVEYS